MSKHDAAYIQACQQEDAMPDKQEVTTKEMSAYLANEGPELLTATEIDRMTAAIRARLAGYDAFQLELGLTAEQNLVMRAELEDLREKRDALKGEVERLTAERNSWKINATVFERDKKKAEAALEKARPLIEAVGGADIQMRKTYIEGEVCQDENCPLLQAALAYRAAQEKEKAND